jgi:hypothetical protein
MLEIRILNNDGIPIPTSDDITAVPSLVGGAAKAKGIVLADYCLSDNGPSLVWKRNLSVDNMAAVSYTKEGDIGSLIVQERKIEDKEQQAVYMKYLATNCLLTRYPTQKKGEEIFLFYIPPYRRTEVNRLIKRQVKAIR